jgi:hypothetical protein
MADARRSRDAYGKPLPSLVEVTQQYFGDHLTNRSQRERLYALLEEQWQVLLRRGIHGQLTITVTIHDGMIQDQSSVTLTRQIRAPKEG